MEVESGAMSEIKRENGRHQVDGHVSAPCCDRDFTDALGDTVTPSRSISEPWTTFPGWSGRGRGNRRGCSRVECVEGMLSAR